MAELLTCRRPTEQVGVDTACQNELTTHGNTTGPTHKAATNTVPMADGGSAMRGRTLLDLLPFAEIWAVDFEFGSEPGENPEPVCLVARELRSGRKVRLWRDEFVSRPALSGRTHRAVCCLLRQRRDRLPSRPRLAGA